MEWDGREQKVGFAEKKLRLTQKWRIVCIMGGVSLPVSGLPQPTLRGSLLWLRRSPSCASGYAFRLHVVHNMPSLMAGLR